MLHIITTTTSTSTSTTTSPYSSNKETIPKLHDTYSSANSYSSWSFTTHTHSINFLHYFFKFQIPKSQVHFHFFYRRRRRRRRPPTVTPAKPGVRALPELFLVHRHHPADHRRRRRRPATAKYPGAAAAAGNNTSPPAAATEMSTELVEERGRRGAENNERKSQR